MSKNAVGRPSSYDPKYCDEILEYFDRPAYVKSGEAKLEATDFPSFAGFAAKIGHHRDTINEWIKEYPEFSVAHKKAKELQESWLLTNGMKGLVETAFGIFTAKNVLGYRDKFKDEGSDVTINLPGLTEEQIDAKIKKLQGPKDE